jgi:hypothetical protein
MDSTTARAVIGCGAVGLTVLGVIVFCGPWWEIHSEKKIDRYVARRRLSLAKRFPVPTRKPSYAR